MKTPELCPLAARAASAEELASKLYGLFDEAKYQPIVLGALGIQSYALIKSMVLGSLYDPSTFPTLALYLDSVLTRNETEYGLYLASLIAGTASPKPFPDYSPAPTKENVWGIRCSDEALRANLTEMTPLIEDFHKESRVIGDITWTTSTLACAQWPFEAKERYTGGFEDIQTKFRSCSSRTCTIR